MTYEEYLKVRKENAREFLIGMLSDLSNLEDVGEVLDGALFQYSRMFFEGVQQMYNSVGLNIELFKVEDSESIYKVKDPNVKKAILDSFFDFQILHEVCCELTDGYSEEHPHKPLEVILAEIDESKRSEILSVIRNNVGENHSIDYIGAGESRTVFGIGDEVIVFGDKRRYSDIPFCLEIRDAVQYDDYNYMYITDKIQTGDISLEESEFMYQNLRDAGYVWVDVKPGNIGRKNGQLKILDDVDIYTKQDALADGGDKTILEFVSGSMNLAMLEINYLKKKNPDFDINSISEYFSNKSYSTLAKIDSIRNEYLRRNATYQFDPSKNYYASFGEVLSANIADYNASFSDDSNKVM